MRELVVDGIALNKAKANKLDLVFWMRKIKKRMLILSKTDCFLKSF